MTRRIDGSTLRRLRYDRGLTQEALAHKSGVHRLAIVRIESGKQLGTPAQVRALAKYFRVRQDELVTEG